MVHAHRLSLQSRSGPSGRPQPADSRGYGSQRRRGGARGRHDQQAADRRGHPAGRRAHRRRHPPGRARADLRAKPCAGRPLRGRGPGRQAARLRRQPRFLPLARRAGRGGEDVSDPQDPLRPRQPGDRPHAARRRRPRHRLRQGQRRLRPCTGLGPKDPRPPGRGGEGPAGQDLDRRLSEVRPRAGARRRPPGRRRAAPGRALQPARLAAPVVVVRRGAQGARLVPRA